MTDLSPFERAVLTELAEAGGEAPGDLALALEADLQRVFATVGALRRRGLVARDGLDTCRLTERGREVAATGAAPAR
ncbi:MAG: hypothetical protein ABEJ40_01125 [Haloarculaceae archaeon]